MAATNTIFDVTGSVSRAVRFSKPDNFTEVFVPVEHSCCFCGKTSFNLRSCTRCWWAKYCNSRCQRGHWPRHKAECRQDPAQRLFFKGGRAVEVDAIPSSEIPEAAFGRSTLFLSLNSCPKNGHNDHADFTGVRELGLEHLPEKIRVQAVVDYLKAESNMTVRVLVKWTSKNRPNEDSCAKFRGTNLTRTASGTCILDNKHDFVLTPCKVPNCPRAEDLGRNHFYYEGDLKIFTNRHVLFDDDELNNTVVDFFYDSDDRDGVVRESATRLFYSKRPTDRTFFKVSIHDKDLLLRLGQLEINRTITFQKIPTFVLRRMSAFAIVVSHPHGMPKKISIGHVIRVTEENITPETMSNAKIVGRLERAWFASRSQADYREYMKALGTLDMPMYKVWYNTPTCQGSSGAPVLFGARQCSGTWGPYMAFHTAYEFDFNLNFFKVARFMN